MTKNVTQTAVNKPLKIFMAEKNINANDLADTLGYKSVHAIYPYLRDERKLSIDQIKAIEKQFGEAPILYGNPSGKESTSITVDMYNQLKKDLEVYRAMCAKLMGVEIANFRNGSLISKQGYKAVEYVQTQMRFPVTAQLTLLMNDKKLSATA